MQVPHHDYRVVQAASSDTVAINVHLPGVTDVNAVQVTIEPPDTVTVLVPDRYHLQLHLSVPIGPHADSVRFKRRTGKLAMLCTVLSDSEAAAAAAAAAAQHEQEDGPEADAMQGAPAENHKQKRAKAAESGADNHLEQQRRPRTDSAPQPTPGGSSKISAHRQQRRRHRRQQQAVKLDSNLPQVVESLDQQLSRKHAPTLVGCWCAAFGALTLVGLWLGESLIDWSKGFPAERVRGGWYGKVSLDLVQLLGLGVVYLTLIPYYVWRLAWTIPMGIITLCQLSYNPREFTRGRSTAEGGVVHIVVGKSLEDNDSLRAGLTKLLLAGISAAVVWRAWVWQLGSHSLGDWLLGVPLLLVWRAAVWMWELLLWRPPAWYPVQMLLGGWQSLGCFVGADTDMLRTKLCNPALVPLQIILTGGGWATLCSFVLSGLWNMVECWDCNATISDTRTHPDKAADKPPGRTTAAGGSGSKTRRSQPTAAEAWWHALAAGMFPTVARSWLLLLSDWGPITALFSAMGAGVQAAVVLLAGALGGTLSSLQAGLQLLTAACCNSLAHVTPARLQPLLGAVAAWVTGAAGRLGWWCVQRAAGAVMGVLCWCAPMWYVGPLVQQACAASGDWQEGCMALLGPHAAQGPDSLSLPHSWWFTVLLHVWLGCVFRQLVVSRAGEGSGRWLQEERQQKLEAARQRKEQKVQQRRKQKKKQGHD